VKVKHLITAVRFVLIVVAVLCLLLATLGFITLFIFSSPENIPAKDLMSHLVIIGLLIVMGLIILYFAMKKMRDDFSAYEVSRDFRRIYPQQPWLWRKDWQQRIISCKQYDEMPFVLTVVICVVLAAIFVATIYYSSLSSAYTTKVAAKSILSTVAFLFVFCWAGAEILRVFMFGRSYFELETMPGILGETIRGKIVMRDFDASGDDFSVKLVCRQTTCTSYFGAGAVLWEGVGRIEEAGKEGAKKQFVRLSAAIPKDMPETKIGGAGATSWWVEVRVKLRPVAYNADFEVPVFSSAH